MPLFPPSAATDGAWLDMTIIAPYTAGTGADKPQYMKDSRGIVHLRGKVIGGAFAGGVIFWAVPAGYRDVGYLASRVNPGVTPTDTVVRFTDNSLYGGYVDFATITPEVSPASDVVLNTHVWRATA